MTSFLTVEQVSAITTLSSQQLYRLVRLKMIPHTRIGGRIFFDPEALRKWISKNSFDPLSSAVS